MNAACAFCQSDLNAQPHYRFTAEYKAIAPAAPPGEFSAADEFGFTPRRGRVVEPFASRNSSSVDVCVDCVALAGDFVTDEAKAMRRVHVLAGPPVLLVERVATDEFDDEG